MRGKEAEEHARTKVQGAMGTSAPYGETREAELMLTRARARW